MTKNLNQYKARYKDLTEKFIIAESMLSACEELTDTVTPIAIQLVYEGVAVKAPMPAIQLVTAEGDDEATVAPSKLTSVQRGTTVYFVATVQSGFTVRRWFCNGEEIANSAGVTELEWHVPDDEEKVYTITVESEATTDAPDTVTNVNVVATTNGCAVSFTPPSANYDHTLVTLQRRSDLSFIHSDNVITGTWSCDDLEPATDYVLGFTVVGANGVQSELVTEYFSTEEEEKNPEPVTDVVVTPTIKGCTFTYTPPEEDFDHVVVTVTQDGVVKHTQETSSTTVDVTNLDTVTLYELSVVAVSPAGRKSTAVTAEFTTLAAEHATFEVRPNPRGFAVVAIAEDQQHVGNVYFKLTKKMTGELVTEYEQYNASAWGANYPTVEQYVAYTIEVTSYNEDGDEVMAHTVRDFTLQLDPVSNAEAQASGSTISVTWDQITTDYDYVEVELIQDGTTLQTEQVAPPLNNCELHDLENGYYRVNVTVHATVDGIAATSPTQSFYPEVS